MRVDITSFMGPRDRGQRNPISGFLFFKKIDLYL